MTMTRNTTIQRGLVLAVCLAALASLGPSCTKPAPKPMVSSEGVPASEGTVDATAGANGNTNVAIRVKHLAPPSKVQADATVYVVWIQPHNAEAQSVGALVVNSNLEGRLDTVTPHRRFAVMVTPEPSGQVSRPTHDPVFTSDIDRVD
jgi:hypothetical protein